MSAERHHEVVAGFDALSRALFDAYMGLRSAQKLEGQAQTEALRAAADVALQALGRAARIRTLSGDEYDWTPPGRVAAWDSVSPGVTPVRSP